MFVRHKMMLMILLAAMLPARFNLCTLAAWQLTHAASYDPCLEETIDQAAQLAEVVSLAAVLALPVLATAAQTGRLSRQLYAPTQLVAGHSARPLLPPPR